MLLLAVKVLFLAGVFLLVCWDFGAFHVDWDRSTKTLTIWFGYKGDDDE